ncbi:hypothetical protein FNV43_RR26502 [Rhamnella rubrinervis]|uniref:Uncharacterized protein n=1 Tax=Rhamnella rubrinervis TaxID=2594499 RepID=A0A8K0DJU2_9ROSA|nr:hypothetical protein FNV43_RR26502 [Rhamnella rubrinervis]
MLRGLGGVRKERASVLVYTCRHVSLRGIQASSETYWACRVRSGAKLGAEVFIEMVGLVPDEGSRRRLPQWMLGVSADEQVRKYDNVEETNINLEGGFVSQAACSQKKTSTVHPGKDCVLCRKDKSLKKSHCLSKCNSKRRKRKSKQQDADCDSNIPETLPEEENGFGVKVPAGRKDERLSFLRLYVRTDKNMEQGQASNRKCESETRLPTTVSHTNKSKGFVDDHICDRPSSTHNISASYKSNCSLKGEQTVINAGITGDPARDMLDLF